MNKLCTHCILWLINVYYIWNIDSDKAWHNGPLCWRFLQRFLLTIMSPCCSGFATKIDGSHQTLMNAILCFASSVICISVLALISHIRSYVGNSNMSIKLFVWEPVCSFTKEKKNQFQAALHWTHKDSSARAGTCRYKNTARAEPLNMSWGQIFLPAKHFSNFSPASLTSHTADLMHVRERIKFNRTGGKRKLHFWKTGVLKYR